MTHRRRSSSSISRRILLILNPQSCDVSTASINYCPWCLIPVAEELNNDSKLEEILWNVSRFDPERRLTLHRTLTFTMTSLHRQSRTGRNSTLRRLRKIGMHTTPNPFVFSRIPWVAYILNFVVIRGRLTMCGTRTGRSFSKVCALLFVLFSTLTSFQASVESLSVKVVLSEHPFNTTSACGVMLSIYHRSQGQLWFSQTKAALQTTVCR